MCSAWYLRKAGFEVSVIDKGDLTDGCSFGNAGMIVPSHFIPMAAPGVIAQGIRWMFDSKSPFYIKPRLDLDLAQWLWAFYRSCTRENVQRAMPVLRDYHQLSKALFREFAQTEGFDFDFETKGLLMLCKNPKTLREEAGAAENAHDLCIETQVLNAAGVQLREPGIRLEAEGGGVSPGDALLYSNKLVAVLLTGWKRK